MQALRFGRTVLSCSCRRLSEPTCTHNVAQKLMSTTPTEPVVIRIPKPMLDRVERTRETRRRTTGKVPVITAGRLLVKSKNPLLNQSVGFTLGKFEETRLCSKGWKHKKSFGDYFTINSTQTVPPFITEGEQEDADTNKSSFAKFRIHHALVEALRRENIIHPTSVQSEVIPKLLRGHNVLCAAETGSGKTLTYLLPIIHDLQSRKEIQNETNTHALILVPSRELATQVLSVSRMLGKEFDLNVRVLGGGRGVGHIKAAFTHGEPDILVSTPGALLKALPRNYVNLSKLRFFVIDEADTMFDPSFAGMLERILHRTDVASTLAETRGLFPKAQMVLVGATFPEGVGEVLNNVTDLGSILTIKSQRLHHLMPHVKQTFVKVRGADKLLELSHALKKVEQEDGVGVLVFCNSASTVNWLGFALEDLGVRHVRLQGAMPASMRQDIFKNFQKGVVNVLVCTDIASRGLDTRGVKLIVNYDFPESHTDYIHRAGRVGRAGGQADGQVLSFVTHKWDVELVQKMEIAARRRTSLPGLESEIHKPSPKIDDVDDDHHPQNK